MAHRVGKFKWLGWHVRRWGLTLGFFSRGLRPWGDDFWERNMDGTWEKTSWEVDEGMTYCMLFAWWLLANILQLVFDVRCMKQEHSGIPCHPTRSSCEKVKKKMPPFLSHLSCQYPAFEVWSLSQWSGCKRRGIIQKQSWHQSNNRSCLALDNLNLDTLGYIGFLILMMRRDLEGFGAVSKAKTLVACVF